MSAFQPECARSLLRRWTAFPDGESISRPRALQGLDREGEECLTREESADKVSRDASRHCRASRVVPNR